MPGYAYPIRSINELTLSMMAEYSFKQLVDCPTCNETF